jgi:hypothetical protein
MPAATPGIGVYNMPAALAFDTAFGAAIRAAAHDVTSATYINMPHFQSSRVLILANPIHTRGARRSSMIFESVSTSSSEIVDGTQQLRF